jgi:hypothetical protein
MKKTVLSRIRLSSLLSVALTSACSFVLAADVRSKANQDMAGNHMDGVTAPRRTGLSLSTLSRDKALGVVTGWPKKTHPSGESLT